MTRESFAADIVDRLPALLADSRLNATLFIANLLARYEEQKAEGGETSNIERRTPNTQPAELETRNSEFTTRTLFRYKITDGVMEMAGSCDSCAQAVCLPESAADTVASFVAENKPARLQIILIGLPEINGFEENHQPAQLPEATVSRPFIFHPPSPSDHTLTLTDPPLVVELKREYRELDERHEVVKLWPDCVAREAELDRVCQAKARIATELAAMKEG